MARVLFYAFVILTVVSFAMHAFRGKA
jgi:uncharacterized membrane protein YtjA (UPF0391 family)